MFDKKRALAFVDDGAQIYVLISNIQTILTKHFRIGYNIIRI